MTLPVNLDLLPAYIELVRKGGYRTSSGGKVWQIARNQFSLWLSYGERDIQRGADSPYAQILRATEDAEAEYERQAHAVLDASDDWRSVAWRLERRFPQTHGDTRKLQVTETAALPQVTAETLSQLTREDVRALAEAAFDLDK